MACSRRIRRDRRGREVFPVCQKCPPPSIFFSRGVLSFLAFVFVLLDFDPWFFCVLFCLKEEKIPGSRTHTPFHNQFPPSQWGTNDCATLLRLSEKCTRGCSPNLNALDTASMEWCGGHTGALTGRMGTGKKTTKREKTTLNAKQERQPSTPRL